MHTPCLVKDFLGPVDLKHSAVETITRQNKSHKVRF